MAQGFDLPSTTHEVFMNEALSQNFLVEKLAGEENKKGRHSF